MNTKFVAFVNTEGGMDTMEVEDAADTRGLGHIYDYMKFTEYMRTAKLGDVHLTGNSVIVLLNEDQANIVLKG